MGKRSVENRLTDLESSSTGVDDEIYVATITPDDESEEWLKPEEYEARFGDLPESEFGFTVNGGSA